MKYLDEVKRAPKSLFSSEVFSEKLFLLNYINAPRQTNAATHAIKFHLNRNLSENNHLYYARLVLTISDNFN